MSARPKPTGAARTEEGISGARRGDRAVATNRRARHDYEILESWECGIVLTGGEVKSLRAGQIVLKDAYARVENGDIWLIGVHIAPWEFVDARQRVDPERPRKLLLHRREVAEIVRATQDQGVTLVPLRVYFTRGLCKVELGLGRGRRKYDKRHAIADREVKRDLERAVKQKGRGDF